MAGGEGDRRTEQVQRENLAQARFLHIESRRETPHQPPINTLTRQAGEVGSVCLLVVWLWCRSVPRRLGSAIRGPCRDGLLGEVDGAGRAHHARHEPIEFAP